MLRVLGALEKAADKRWGPMISDRPPSPKREPKEKPIGSDAWRKECPRRQRARDFLRANPTSTNQEITAATGISKHIIAEVRREFGLRCPRTRGYETRKRIAEILAAKPYVTAKEVSRAVGVGERYAQDVIKRLKWEKTRI